MSGCWGAVRLGEVPVRIWPLVRGLFRFYVLYLHTVTVAQNAEKK
jgi:hypothetical protein